MGSGESSMKARLLLIGVAAALAGCVQVHVDDPKPGQYSNYREMAYHRMQLVSFKGLPESLNAKLRTCAVDAAWPYYTPKELEALDAYARGEKPLPGWAGDLDHEIAMRMGGTAGINAKLQRQCGDVLTEAKNYQS
jgi:hypothetical protein